MIRREFITPDGAKLWLLISQVEHARVSGEIACHWHEQFDDDVIGAIAHHDDGWKAWEAEPKLNPDVGAPFSFLEMPLPAALVIWDHSIAAAARFGPLGSYLVAGHFYKLLSDSEQANEPLAQAWLAAKRKERTTWLDNWIRADPAHTLDYARRAQQMLLLADLFSLWLCCDAPVDDRHESILSQSSMKLQTGTLLKQFQLAVPEFELHRAFGSDRVDRLQWTVSVQPYPFTVDSLPVSVLGIAAPAARYENWQEVAAASWPFEFKWGLKP